MITFSLLLQDAVVRGWGCGRWDDGIQIGEEGNREVGKRQSKNRTMKSWVGVGMWVGARGELVLEMLWVCSPISLTQHVQSPGAEWVRDRGNTLWWAFPRFWASSFPASSLYLDPLFSPVRFSTWPYTCRNASMLSQPSSPISSADLCKAAAPNK